MGEHVSFGAWLKRRRKLLDLTQEQLAERVGCALGTIRKLETDERRPSKQIAERLADQLGLAADERVAFLQVARAELAADRLPPPSRTVPQEALLPQSALPRGTVTFLFTDIEGSTRLWQQHPQAMGAAVARHEAILRDAITAAVGVVFKTVGDAVCAAFASALDALLAALAGQRALRAEAWGVTSPLQVRMALHTGVVEARAGDYAGLPLSRLARILAAGHGGQILLSLATQELVREQLPPEVALRDLGAHRLKDLTRAEPIFQLVAPDLPADFPSLRTLAEQRHNLPVQPTALIGREQEVAAVNALLRQPDVRLVTLTGPGGVGKTRLAVQVAAELLDSVSPPLPSQWERGPGGEGQFGDGIFFVNLAPVHDPALVLPTIAQTLGLAESTLQPTAQEEAERRSLHQRLVDYLRAKRMLLLLDNFEQVVDAAPQLAELLAAAPHVKALVTSRAVLHLSGEHEFAVPSLALPPRSPAALPTSGEGPPTAPPRPPQRERGPGGEGDLTQYDAVRLFIERAQAAKVNFAVTNENAPAIAEICYRLDGLPLAIELAAARVKLFPPQALLARLSSRMKFLTGGARDLPQRQQTIRNTIDWSYELLDPGERTLFARLGVFVGGCTIEAVEAVCNPAGDLPSDVVDGIVALADKSLLRQQEGVDGEPRFTMLETIREYALEQLAARGEVETLRRRHAEYYVALAEAAEPRLKSAEQQAWLDRLEQEHDNLRAALAWSLHTESVVSGQWSGATTERQPTTDNGRRTDLGLWLVAALARFWELRGDREEWRAWVRRAAAGLEAAEPTVARAKVLLQAGIMVHDEEGDHARGIALVEESLALARALGDLSTSSAALCELGRMAHERGDQTQAVALAQESLALARASGDTWCSAQTLCRLGEMAYTPSDLAQARAWLADSLRLFEQLGDTWGRARALGILAFVTVGEGDLPQAMALLEQGLALNQALGSKGGSAWMLGHLGNLACWLGDYSRAAAYDRESLALYRELGDRRGIALTLHFLGDVAREQGDYTWATALFEESQALWRELNDSSGIAGGLMGYGDVLLNQGDASRGAACYQEAVIRFRELGYQSSWATALRGLGRAALMQGDDARALALLAESLASFRERQVLLGIGSVLAAIAGVRAARGQPLRAARLFGASEVLRRTSAAPTGAVVEYARDVARVRAQLDEATFAAAWEEGKMLTVEQAIVEALTEGK